MALTGMAIYKNLPKTNCKDCGFPTCMAFAMQVAAKQKALTDCPHLAEDAKAQLSDASAPPMKLITIGSGEGVVEIGQETVMFRHEEKFHKPPALAVAVPATVSDQDALALIDKINSSTFTRVGQQIGVRMAAIELAGLTNDAAAARAKSLSDKSRVPLVLMSDDAETMSAAVKAIAAKKPLIYRANPGNMEPFTRIAAEAKCPLAITADNLETLADIAKSAKAAGVTDIVLSFDTGNPAETIRTITTARRAALKKTFRDLGFPAMVDASRDDSMTETVLASTFSAKYAAIIIIKGVDPSELLPILTTIQNIYTDPQVPNTVESRLYEVGHANETSPVLFTTNFSLTYFCVEGEVERSKIPAYICAVDTEGLGVLNAYAGDKLSPEKVVKTLDSQGVADKVKHRKLIIPGLLPSFRAQIEDISPWKEVMIGPENASGIPTFLNKEWK